MYAVIEYNNYRKEQNFEIKLVTNDLDYAKKIAFNNAKNDIKNSSHKITTNINEHHLRPINKTIIEYMIVEVCEYKNDQFRIISTFSKVYSVIELTNHEKLEILDDIDEKLIFNSYWHDHSDEGDY